MLRYRRRRWLNRVVSAACQSLPIISNKRAFAASDEFHGSPVSGRHERFQEWIEREVGAVYKARQDRNEATK
jgi:hypothetical protein